MLLPVSKFRFILFFGGFALAMVWVFHERGGGGRRSLRGGSLVLCLGGFFISSLRLSSSFRL